MFTKPGKGKLKIGKHSSLRKLMRAARRGRIPDERIVIIETAEKKAADRAEIYLHACRRQIGRLQHIAPRN